VDSWLRDRSIETWLDGKPVSTQKVNCGGSPWSPVVDDCSWAFSFTGKKDFQEQTKAQLDNI